MRKAIYPRLAADGIRKNKKLYIPYILTCAGMVMMYYIVIFLQYDGMLLHMPSGDVIQTILGFGGNVIALFSCVFLFYTNTFVMRRRKKEFGLFNILGMGKGNICVVILWEWLMVSALSLAAGLLFGVTFSKLFEMLLVRMLGGDVSYSATIPPRSLLMTAAVFGAIFILLLINSLLQIYFSRAVSLVRSENIGEKPPKANWFFGILGIAILAAAYTIAVRIKDPVSALTMFFVAVIMVIVATYLIMISGSVLLCRVLQKNKRYYYKKNHFVSVSSMAYRMKRNGTGLASICILITMVLVMVSSTASLYFGSEDTLSLRYPREINIELNISDKNTPDAGAEAAQKARQAVYGVAEGSGVEMENTVDYLSAQFPAILDGSTFSMATSDNIMASSVWIVYVMSLDEYNRSAKSPAALGEGEALIFCKRSDYTGDTVRISDGKSYSIAGTADVDMVGGEALASIYSYMYVVVPDDVQTALGSMANAAGSAGEGMLQYIWTFGFDAGLDADAEVQLCQDISAALKPEALGDGLGSAVCDSREENRENYFSMFGGLFYLGIMLSVVFMFAAVLIIYYKQLSEGYEDQSRFDIMQKVGMTKREIRKSINSQLLLVFFLPPLGAALHLVFAFPMIKKMLLAFGLNNTPLFAAVTAISFIVFLFVYVVVYRITSNTYFGIVSGAKKEVRT